MVDNGTVLNHPQPTDVAVVGCVVVSRNFLPVTLSRLFGLGYKHTLPTSFSFYEEACAAFDVTTRFTLFYRSNERGNISETLDATLSH